MTTKKKRTSGKRLGKKKVKQKGTGKKCWCGRQALRSGYCAEHLGIY